MKKINKNYDNDWPIVAICYDFDKTLSPQDMQNFDLIPQLNCTVEEFWTESNNYAKEQGMDKILSYMKLIIKKAQGDVSIKREAFNKLGEGIVLFPGVDTWFSRINEYAEKLNVKVEHYIISAGLKEIIEGTSIAKAGSFTEIYASSFVYNPVYGNPIWPCQVVNYTTKTQYLFRISKNCLDLSDEDSVNEYIEDENRRIPLRNFIYIGDSDTDIPAMKIVKNGGGTSIGVYNPETANISKVSKLLQQKRIDFLMPALYTEGSRLEVIVKAVIDKVKATERLEYVNQKQKDLVEDLEELDGLYVYTEKFLQNAEYQESDIKDFRKQAKSMVRQGKKYLHNYDAVMDKDDIDKVVAECEKGILKLFDDKKSEMQQKNKNLLESKDESSDKK